MTRSEALEELAGLEKGLGDKIAEVLTTTRRMTKEDRVAFAATYEKERKALRMAIRALTREENG